MAVFDAVFLVYLLDSKANPPLDPASGRQVSNLPERIEYLIKTLGSKKEKIVIPTPALSEYLVGADSAGAVHLQRMQSESAFQIVPFDARAAIELAILNQQYLQTGDKKGGSTAPWQKIKLDRQIVAIAKVAGEKAIYSGDDNLHKFALDAGLATHRISDLPLPPEDGQSTLAFD